jgi:hypothetical protein
MDIRKSFSLLLVLCLAVPAALAKSKNQQFLKPRPLTPEQSALVQEAIQNENKLIAEIKHTTPIVETYIQDTRPDPKLITRPVEDYYMLSRVSFNTMFYGKNFDAPADHPQKGFWKLTGNLNILKGLKGHYVTNGFIDNMFMDTSGVSRNKYTFIFVRKEFLGSVRTSVFDVQPSQPRPDLFYGRIWVEDQGGNIVRLNGVLTAEHAEFFHKGVNFHYDCWRTNVRPGLWLPTAIYVEEAHRTGEKSVGLKAQTYVWGYSLNAPASESESVTMKVDDAEDKSNDETGRVSPLEATRQWVEQSENNVMERLETAGVVAPVTPDGYETKVLDQIVTNLEVPNNLAFPHPVHCRVLLTTTIEATTAGHTILLSKGLLDAMPNEETIASVIALELAHVVLGHQMDTRYAFNDRLIFPDEDSFEDIYLHHSDADNAAAAKRAMVYLRASMYKDKLPQAGLFWEQLADSSHVLKALTSPRLGDSLVTKDGTPVMSELARSAPKINPDDLAQIPALPLGSWLKTDPWDDRVTMLTATRYAPMNAAEKMPLEVTPVYFMLQRKDAAQPTNAAAPAPQPPAQSATQPASQSASVVSGPPPK